MLRRPLIRGGSCRYWLVGQRFAVRLRLWNPVRFSSGDAVLIGAVVNVRNFSEVPVRDRRRCLPFQRGCLPRILLSHLPAEHAPKYVYEQQNLSRPQNKSKHRNQYIYPLHMLQKFVLRRVGDSPHVPPNAEDVHREKDAVKGNERNPKMNLANNLIHVPPKHFGEPVKDASKNGEDAAAEDNIMNMRHNIVCIVDVDVYRRICHIDAAQPANDEH